MQDTTQVVQSFGEQLQERAISLIDTLAGQLGVAAEHVYQVLGKQMLLEGGVMLATVVICIIITISFVQNTFKRFKVLHALDRSTSDGEDMMTMVMVAGAIIAIIAALIFATTEGPIAIMKLVNPEYYVIKELLSVL